MTIYTDHPNMQILGMTYFTPNSNLAKSFWQSHPDYTASPLTQICNHALSSDIFVKDESKRLGLGSFKALGGIYAVAKLIAEQCSFIADEHLTYSELQSTKAKFIAKMMSFTCASAGNQGLAVATGAKIFGSKAHIFLSHQVLQAFELKLNSLGANVIRAGNTYEQSVEAAKSYAETKGSQHLADGSWQGYRHPPSLVMEGYSVIAEELRSGFETSNQWPSHVFLQAGIGGMVAALTYMVRKYWTVQPTIIIVEPDKAACLKLSHEAGLLSQATGGLSNMGRLDCKDASLLAFEIFKNSNVEYLTISDEQAIQAVTKLTSYQLFTTESGAAGMAGLQKYIKTQESLNGFRPLIVMTEGKIT